MYIKIFIIFIEVINLDKFINNKMDDLYGKYLINYYKYIRWVDIIWNSMDWIYILL